MIRDDLPPRRVTLMQSELEDCCRSAGWPITLYSGGSGFYALHHGVLLLCLATGEWSLRSIEGKSILNGFGAAALASALAQLA